jgi:predicted RNase H-like HicB family nuclease
MLLEYIQAAMRKAKYEILPDDGTFYGNIPECQGVWANAKTLEECRAELQEVLEDWILIKVRHGDGDLPVIDGIDVNLHASDQEVA